MQIETFFMVSNSWKAAFWGFCCQNPFEHESIYHTSMNSSSKTHQNSDLSFPMCFSCLDWLRSIKRFIKDHFWIWSKIWFWWLFIVKIKTFDFLPPVFRLPRGTKSKISSDRYISTTKHVFETAASAFQSSSQGLSTLVNRLIETVRWKR